MPQNAGFYLAGTQCRESLPVKEREEEERERERERVCDRERKGGWRVPVREMERWREKTSDIYRER